MPRSQTQAFGEPLRLSRVATKYNDAVIEIVIRQRKLAGGGQDLNREMSRSRQASPRELIARSRIDERRALIRLDDTFNAAKLDRRRAAQGAPDRNAELVTFHVDKTSSNELVR